MAAKQQKKRGKNPDTSPNRSAYWHNGHLQSNKVRRIMRNTGMSKSDATEFWIKTRGYRRMKSFFAPKQK